MDIGFVFQDSEMLIANYPSKEVESVAKSETDSDENKINPRWAQKKLSWRKRGAFSCLILLVLLGICLLVWFSLTLALLQRLSPPATHNALQTITKNWKGDSSSVLSPWPADFSQDILPINCHSHNDYWRRVPLYDALEAGCTGVEADIWFINNDLYVGHTKSSLKPTRTLRSLYIDPLIQILQNQNQNQTVESKEKAGVFQRSPNTSLTLLLDVKTNGTTTWPIALQQLEPLRQQGFLTYFNGTDIIPGPITVVGTGNTPFELLISNTTYRDAFFDAPLNNLTDIYTKENSYYASVSLQKAVGKTRFRGLSEKQLAIIKSQIDEARSRGLKARYWDLPAWPVGLRDGVWSDLVENGVGMLNVDDLVSAAKWNWSWCTILGFNLC